MTPMVTPWSISMIPVSEAVPVLPVLLLVLLLAVLVVLVVLVVGFGFPRMTVVPVADIWPLFFVAMGKNKTFC